MRRTRATDNAGSKPAKSDSASGGYYTSGPPATVFSADDANMFQEELVAIAGLKGVSLDTTGANDHQCADALEGVKAIEAKNVEATGVDSYWSMAVIASDDAEVGEDDDGAEHCLVAAAQDCKAKGFESAAIASYGMRAIGDNSTVLASKRASGYGAVTGDQSAIIAASYASGSSDLVQGDASAVIGGAGNTISLDQSVIAGGNGNANDGSQSFIGGGNSNHLDGSDKSAIVGGLSNELISVEQGAAVGGSYNSIEYTSHGATNSVVVGGNHNTIADAEDAIIAGGDNNRIGSACDGAAIIGSQYARVDSNANCVVLGSRHVDTDLSGTDAANYSVVGGYDATTDQKPSWAIQSNGGVIYATNTTVQGVDYAELIPNKDGVRHLPGRLLCFDGRGVRLARAGDECEGVVSVHPTVLGGSDELGWAKTYKRDRWGAFETEVVEEISVRPPDRSASREAESRRQAAARAWDSAQSELARAEVEHVRAQARVSGAGETLTLAVADLVEREAHAEARAQALAEAGKIRKILRGSSLERLAARAAAAANDARNTAASARAELESEASRLAAAGAALEAARAAVMATPSEPDLSDLDLLPRAVSRMVTQRAVNPALDRKMAKAHVPRTRRPDEWTAMGVLGQMRVAVDQTVRAGSFVVPGAEPGIGTHADRRGEGIRIKVLEIESPFDESEGCAVAYCWVGR